MRDIITFTFLAEHAPLLLLEEDDAVEEEEPQITEPLRFFLDSFGLLSFISLPESLVAFLSLMFIRQMSSNASSSELLSKPTPTKLLQFLLFKPFHRLFMIPLFSKILDSIIDFVFLHEFLLLVCEEQI